jgi:hypothetical protein
MTPNLCRCSDDARGVAVALTPAGWAALRDAAPPHVDSVRRHLIDLLTPAEVTALATIAAKVTEHLAALDAAEAAEAASRGRAGGAA